MEMTPAMRLPFYVVALLLRWGIALAGSVGIIAVIYHLGTDLSKHMREHLEPLVREPWLMCAATGAGAPACPERRSLRAVVPDHAGLRLLCDTLCQLLGGVRVGGRGHRADVLAVHHRAERSGGRSSTEFNARTLRKMPGLRTPRKDCGNAGTGIEHGGGFRRLVRAGLDVARLNFSHGSHEQKAELIAMVRKVARGRGASRSASWPTCRGRRSAPESWWTTSRCCWWRASG
jgi:hypothetical protein